MVSFIDGDLVSVGSLVITVVGVGLQAYSRKAMPMIKISYILMIVFYGIIFRYSFNSSALT